MTIYFFSLTKSKPILFIFINAKIPLVLIWFFTKILYFLTCLETNYFRLFQKCNSTYWVWTFIGKPCFNGGATNTRYRFHPRIRTMLFEIFWHYKVFKIFFLLKFSCIALVKTFCTSCHYFEQFYRIHQNLFMKKAACKCWQNKLSVNIINILDKFCLWNFMAQKYWRA